jgi:hypothetical protein
MALKRLAKTKARPYPALSDVITYLIESSAVETSDSKYIRDNVSNSTHTIEKYLHDQDLKKYLVKPLLAGVDLIVCSFLLLVYGVLTPAS